MGRIARSFQIFKQSYGLLMKDKELMVLPLLSGLVILVVAASFVLGMGLFAGGAAEAAEAMEQAEQEADWGWALGGFAFYVITYTIAIYFQAAVVAGANERLSGGDPTVRSALRAANGRLGTIVLWGLVAGTIGLLIRAIQERSEVVGRIILGIVGVVWSLATYFVVPVIVMEGKGVGGSLSRSWEVFKRTWGETVTAGFGFGIVGFLLTLPIVGIAALLYAAGLEVVAVVVAVLMVALLSVFLSALQGVFTASLYRYATVGDVAEGIDRDLLENAFRPK